MPENDPMPTPQEGETDEQYQARLETRLKVDTAIILGDVINKPEPSVWDISLAEWLSAPPADFPLEAPERWSVQDDGAAAWAIKKLRGIREHIAMNESIAQEEIARINEWLKGVNKTLTDSAGFFEINLKNYALEQRRDADRKSIKLPHGTLQTTAGQTKWTIDNEVFIAWAKINAPDLVKIEESPKLGEAKKVFNAANGVAVTQEGEIVAGVTTEDQPPTATVKTN